MWQDYKEKLAHVEEVFGLGAGQVSFSLAQACASGPAGRDCCPGPKHTATQTPETEGDLTKVTEQ